jgi:hypothetical protein
MERSMQAESDTTTPITETHGYASVDALLDRALEMTFPASDPIAVNFDRRGRSSESELKLSSERDPRADSETQQVN